MNNTFKIYIDRLKNGHAEKIAEIVDPGFLEIEEKDLEFRNPVNIQGETYLADDHLIIHVKIATEAIVPCSICNEKFKIPINIDNFYHAEPIKELKDPIFNYTQELREAVLLQVPPFIECQGGNCPERESIAKYLKKHEGSLPFKDL